MHKVEVTHEEHREHCVSIISSLLSRSSPRLLTAGRAHIQHHNEPSAVCFWSGIGGMVMRKGCEYAERTDRIMQRLRTRERAHHFIGFLICFLFSWHGGLQMEQALLYNTAACSSQRRSPCTFCAPSPPQRRARWHCVANAYPIPIRSKDEYACPRLHRCAGGAEQLGKIAVIRDGLTQKHG